MATSGNIYAGSCHCGAVVFTYRTDQAPPEWSMRACQCSYCRAHAALSTSDPAGQVEFRQLGDGAMHRYRFGQRITDFLVCGECGVYVGAVMEAPMGQFGIINVNALRPIPAGLAAPLPMHYGSESAEQRMTRRVARWTPVASIAPRYPHQDTHAPHQARNDPRRPAMDTPIKTTAVEFLRMVAAGAVREAFRLHVADTFRHHNPYFAGQRQALLEAMEQSSAAEPNKALDIHQVIADGDTVAVHSRLQRAAGQHGYAVVHILKFAGGKVIEMWDVAQEIPSEQANDLGMF